MKLLDVAGLMDRLTYSKAQVYHIVQRREIEFLRIGTGSRGPLRFSEKAVQEYIDKRMELTPAING